MEVGASFSVNLVWREKGEHWQWHEDCVGTKKKKVEKQLGTGEW